MATNAIGEYRLNVIGFIEDCLGVKLHDGQKLVLETSFPRDVEPEDWPYRQICLTAANRWGKSVLIAGLHIWFSVFKHRVGLDYGTQEWFDAKYNVVNVCPLNDLAYVVREKVGELIADEAKEQIQREGGRGHINPGLQALFMKSPQPGGKNPFLVRIEDTEYVGFRTKHGSSLEYRTTDDHAKALQGRKKYLVSYDEFTRDVDPLLKLASDIMPRTMDTRGIIFLAGTPHLETESTAEEVWQQGDPDNPDRVAHAISFNRPIEDNPAITTQMIEEMVDGLPDYLKPQVLEGKFVQSDEAFFNAESVRRARIDLPNRRRRVNGHQYIVGLDLAIAKSGDRTIAIVVDVSTSPVTVVEYKEFPKGTIHPIIVQEMYKLMNFYNDPIAGTKALMVYDATGLAGYMWRTEFSVIYPKPKAFDFAGKAQKKLSILHSVRMLFDKSLIVMPKTCERLAYEIVHYKRNDAKLETDSVLALALATYLIERTKGRLGNDTRIVTKSLAA